MFASLCGRSERCLSLPNAGITDTKVHIWQCLPLNGRSEWATECVEPTLSLRAYYIRTPHLQVPSAGSVSTSVRLGADAVNTS